MPRLVPLALAGALVAAAVPATPASAALIVSTKAKGGKSVHTITRADGRRARTIPCPRGKVLASPTGDRVLCGRGSKWRIMTLATRRSVAIFLPTGNSVTNLAWAPDGDRIAVALRGAGAAGRIGITDPRTGGMVVIRTLDPGVGVGAVSWAPDSTSVAYVQRSGDPAAGAAHVVDARTGADRALLAVPGVGAGRTIDWSRRGEIAVADGTGRIQVVRPDGTVAATLGRASERAVGLEWAPSGDRLAVQTAGRGARWRVVERSGAVRVVRVTAAAPLAWAPNSKLLAAATAKAVVLVSSRGSVSRRWKQYKRVTAVSWATPRSIA